MFSVKNSLVLSLMCNTSFLADG